MLVQRSACMATSAGCLRCTMQAQECDAPQTALLLACRDAHVQAALTAALQAGGFAFRQTGAALLIADARLQAEAITTFLRDRLAASTQGAIRAVYLRENAAPDEMLRAACFDAETLPDWIERGAHEWVRQALAEDWFFSMFQPIVGAHTGATFAHEALIRARDPHSGQVYGAGPIIAACERLQLQHQLDQRARQSAIRSAASLGLASGHFFINFMPNTIYDPEICLRTTMVAADTHGMELSRLVFEVVESEDIPDMKRLAHILDYYRSRGVGTAVDDLGAGFAALPYLDALRPDYAKIDRQLVVDAAQDDAARVRLEQIIAAAKRLNIRVIAEGIETPEQLHVCRQAGADFLQGYLFARPAYPPAASDQTHFAAAPSTLSSLRRQATDRQNSLRLAG